MDNILTFFIKNKDWILSIFGVGGAGAIILEMIKNYFKNQPPSSVTDDNSGNQSNNNANTSEIIEIDNISDHAKVIIKITKNKFSKNLETLYEENNKLLKEKNISDKEDKEKYELLTQNSALKEKLADIDQSYKDYIVSLEKQISDLKNNSHLPEQIKKQAIEALSKGDNKEADRLFAKINDESVVIEVAEVRYQRTLIAESDLRYHDALNLIQKALFLVPDNALYLHQAGWLAHILGEYKNAINFFEKFFKIINIRNIYEDNPVAIANACNSLGEAYRADGQYDKAIEYHTRSLEIWCSLSSKDNDPNIALSYNNLGKTYYGKRNIQAAISYYNLSLLIYIKIFGEEHFLTVKTYNNLGLSYRKIDYDKAMEYYKKSLHISRNILNPNHPHIAQVLQNIGFLYCEKKDYYNSILCYDECIRIRIAVLGENHPHLATSYNNLGEAYRANGEYDKAIEYYNKALIIYPKEHPDTVKVKENLALAEQKMNGG